VCQDKAQYLLALLEVLARWAPACFVPLGVSACALCSWVHKGSMQQGCACAGGSARDSWCSIHESFNQLWSCTSSPKASRKQAIFRRFIEPPWTRSASRISSRPKALLGWSIFCAFLDEYFQYSKCTYWPKKITILIVYHAA